MRMTYMTTMQSVRAASPVPWVALALMALVALPCAALPVVNGTFDSGLAGWTTVGDVQAVTDASLGDNGVDYSLLYQGVALAPGTFRLEFDFMNLLSADVSEDFAFPDVFFASLYFTNDLGTFDLANAVFDDVAPLMDLDASGPSNVAGTVGASALGPDWAHFTFDFSNSYAYVVPVFELLNFNFLADSEVRLDNVAISQVATVVPEPASLSLLVMGLAACAAVRRRYGKSV